MNGVLLGEGSEVALNQGDTIEIRKKRFRIGFPSEEEVEVFKQEEVSPLFSTWMDGALGGGREGMGKEKGEVELLTSLFLALLLPTSSLLFHLLWFRLQHHTPRRNRPSHRFSLLPKDLLFSPYAKQDALEQEQQNQLAASSPSKRAAFAGSPRPSSRLAQPEEEEQEQGVEEEEEVAVAAPAQEEVALDSSEEESEQESELEEHSEKENVPVRSTPAKVRFSLSLFLLYSFPSLEVR